MLSGYGALPGIGAIQENTERALHWANYEKLLFSDTLVIDSTAVDAGNTPTTQLRAGLLLGKKTSDGNLYQFDPSASDGTEVVHGILMRDIAMLDPVTQAVADRAGHVLLGGPVKAADLLILGTAFNSHQGENIARRQMTQSGRFIFDDEPLGKNAFLGGPISEIAKTANYTVLEADNGKLFTNAGAAGAVTFTLPAIRSGLMFEFLVVAGQNVTVASAEGDNIVAFNDAAADSLTFSTAGQLIGGHLQLFSNAAGTLWYFRNLSPGNTITVAT